jgi:signal transduction histidine kinase
MQNAERANQRYRLLARHLPGAAVALFDKDLNYVLVEGSLLRDFNVDPTLLEGQPVASTIQDVDERESIRARCLEVFEGKNTIIEFTHEGRTFTWDTCPVFDDENAVYLGMILVFDVTEARRHEAEREALLAQTQQALKIRDDFLSIAAHELKTPLTSILGFSQLLHHRAFDDLKPEDQRVVQTILAQSDRLSFMINALLDTTRIQQGTIRLELRACDAMELTRKVVDTVQISTARHKIVFECPDPVIVARLDRARIEQVLRNLVSNAVKYSPTTNRIVVSLVDGPQDVTWIVHDYGIGIPPEDLDRIFDQYYRGSNLGPHINTQISGLGIGLYVSKVIVELHGGTIGVESRVNQGSTFIVRIPR